MRIVRRLLTKLICATSLVIFAGLILNILIFVSSFVHEVDEKTELEQHFIGRVIKHNYEIGNLVRLRSELESIAAAQGWTKAEFRNEDGEILWQHPRNKELIHAKQPIFPTAGRLVFSLLGYGNVDANLIISKELIVGDSTGDPLGILTFAFSASLMWNSLFVRIISMLAAIILLWGLFIAVTWYLARQALTPLMTLVSEIQKEGKKVNVDFRLSGDTDEVSSILLWFRHLTESWIQTQNRLVGVAKIAALGRLARQVAHDIRSPLAALDSAAKDVAELPEEKRIIMRSAIARIRDIANHLLEKHRQSPVETASLDQGSSEASFLGKKTSVYLLSSLIDPVITEKRLQLGPAGPEVNFDFNADSYGLFAQIEPAELKRVISNLVNNAAEALKDNKNGRISVSLTHEDKSVLLKVQDNGKGIPPEILGKLGERGVSHDKPGGSGLGLYHAKTYAISCAGSLDIKSEPGKGTAVTLALPQAQPPNWFVEQLEISSNTPIVILDDDESIHLLWQERFGSLKAKEQEINIIHLYNPNQLREWIKDNPQAAHKAHYLLDYELLGHGDTGLSLAQELNLGKQAILVTSRFEEKEVMNQCIHLNIRMIPKGLAGFVPISIAPHPTSPPQVGREAAVTPHPLPSQGQTLTTLPQGKRETADAVLIDDDSLVHMTWKVAAKSKGISLKSFKNPKEFLTVVEQFSKETPIYLDSDLGEGILGEEIAKKLHDMGFTKLYLATGHPAESFKHLGFMKKVVGKEPPWA